MTPDPVRTRVPSCSTTIWTAVGRILRMISRRRPSAEAGWTAQPSTRRSTKPARVFTVVVLAFPHRSRSKPRATPGYRENAYLAIGGGSVVGIRCQITGRRWAFRPGHGLVSAMVGPGGWGAGG